MILIVEHVYNESMELGDRFIRVMLNFPVVSCWVVMHSFMFAWLLIVLPSGLASCSTPETLGSNC
jgi:hypothetical protein